MDKHLLKILFVEDDSQDIILFRNMLSQESSCHFDVHHVERLSIAIDLINKEVFDAIILDLSLPDSSGIETIKRLDAKERLAPIIVLTGLDDEDTGIAALREGAQDYLVKGQLSGNLLARIIRHAIERKRLEQMKDEFISSVSHELRTPLTIIQEGISQILDGILGDVADTQKKILSICFSNATRLSRIVDDLLDIAKLESRKVKLNVERINIVDLIKHNIEEFLPQLKNKGLEAKQSFCSDCVDVFIDKHRITQVIMNLMNNALKFTDKGYIEFSVVEKEDKVECSVLDTGRGVSKENLPKLFNKFEQFNREAGPGIKGTGLGLSICKGIVELHNGEIFAESDINVGTKISFSLPKVCERDVLRGHFSSYLKDFAGEGAGFSIVVLSIENIDLLKKELGVETVLPVLNELFGTINQCSRGRSDKAVKFSRGALGIFPNARKEDALKVAQRIDGIFQEYAVEKKLNEKINVNYHIVSCPEDGATEDDLIEKIYNT